MVGPGRPRGPAGSAECPGAVLSSPGFPAARRGWAPLDGRPQTQLGFSTSEGMQLRALELDSWLPRGRSSLRVVPSCVSADCPTSTAGSDWSAPCCRWSAASSGVAWLGRARLARLPFCGVRDGPREDAASPVTHSFHIPSGRWRPCF